MPDFSQRLPWPFRPNQLYFAIQQKRASAAQLLDLTCSNPTIALSNYPHRQIAEQFHRLSSVTYRPQPFGDLSARSTLAELFRASGVPVAADKILLTASTSEAYGYLFALLCNAGEEVLTPCPSYPLFDHLAGLASVKLVPYRLLYDGAWHIDFNHLRSVITNHTRAIVVVNPNNPTGHFLTTFDRKNLVSLAVERDLALISDEVFVEYSLDTRHGPQDSLASNRDCLTFCLGGLSKRAGMPQLKLAWTLISGPNPSTVEACERLETIADAYLSVGTPVQLALQGLLRLGDAIREAIQQRLSSNLATLDQLLASSPLSRLHLEGGWSAILRLPQHEQQIDWALHILNNGEVLVQPGYFFDLESPACIVVSLLTPPDEFESGIRRICDLAAD